MELKQKKELINNLIIDNLITNISIMNNDEIISKINDIAVALSIVTKSNGIIYTCGNGGSAADAEHIVTEISGKFLKERSGYSAICLNSNTSLMTAIANDYGYEHIFSRQLNSITRNDALIVISTSGNSKNVINAILEAKKHNSIIVGLTGNDGGLMKDLCNICIVIPSKSTPHIQESHMLIYHIICQLYEDIMTIKENTNSPFPAFIFKV